MQKQKKRTVSVNHLTNTVRLKIKKESDTNKRQPLSVCCLLADCMFGCCLACPSVCLSVCLSVELQSISVNPLNCEIVIIYFPRGSLFYGFHRLLYMSEGLSAMTELQNSIIYYSASIPPSELIH